MDEFLKVMFTIACKWKHGKDVSGLAAEKLKSGDLDAAGARGFKAGLQAENVKKLKRACSAIEGRGKGKCRQSCADRWGTAMEERSGCDAKCVAAYAAFEKSCTGKAENLEQVYEMKLKMGDSRKRCHEGHCAEFPTAWAKAGAAAMQAEVDARCGDRCTDDQIEARCERKWTLEVDFLRSGIRSKCQEASAVSNCFDGKKATVSTAHESCSSEGVGTCDTQYVECTAKGNTDATFKEAGDFCTSRKELCLEQVKDKCLETHNAALEKAAAECQRDSKEAFDKCESDALTAKETEEVGKCQTDLGPKCSADCQQKCDTAALGRCLQSAAGDGDAARGFCEGLWSLLHESSEVDPMTGNPIVLLSPGPG